MNAAQHQKWNQSQWICRCHVTPVKTSLFNSSPKRINLLFNFQLQCLTCRWPFGMEEMRYLAARLQRNVCTIMPEFRASFISCRMIPHKCTGIDLLATAHLGQFSILFQLCNFVSWTRGTNATIQWLAPELGVQTLKVQMQMSINAWKCK